MYAKGATANGSFPFYCPPWVHVTNDPLFAELPQSGLSPHPSECLKKQPFAKGKNVQTDAILTIAQ